MYFEPQLSGLSTGFFRLFLSVHKHSDTHIFDGGTKSTVVSHSVRGYVTPCSIKRKSFAASKHN